MKILQGFLATPAAPMIAAVVEDSQELRALKERVKALEGQATSPPHAEASEFSTQLARFKTDFDAEWQAAASAIRKTLDAFEERLRSCEQAPRLLAETVLKEMEARLRGEIAALDKNVNQRFGALPIPAPAPMPVEKPASAPAADWDTRFERHEKALAELVKEIAVAAPPPAPVVLPPPAPGPSIAMTPSVTSVTAAVEISKPDEDPVEFPEIDAPKFELLDHPVRHRPRSRSAVVRFWHYLNAPAFGAERPAD